MSDDAIDGIILQLAMAFGQGTGTVLATEEALLVARNSYRHNLASIAPHWSDFALQAIEYSRVLGRLSASHAVRHGRCVIEEPDVTYALAKVQANAMAPLGVCRITGASTNLKA